MFKNPLIFPALAAILLLALVCTFAQVDLDIFHLMALGRDFASLGHVPTVDTASYLPTLKPVVHHEWLTGVLLYYIVQQGGAYALMAARWILIALIVTITVIAARKRNATAPLLLILAPLAINLVGPAFTMIRPQVFTLLFTAVLLSLLAHKNRWVLPAILCMHLIWLNMHAGFVVGLGLLLLHIIEESLRDKRIPWPLVAALLFAAPMILLTPFGWDYPPYLLRAITMSRGIIYEWKPIWHADPYLLGGFALSLLIALYALLKAKPKNCRGLLTLAVCAIMAIAHQRHASIYGLVWFILLPGWLAHTPLAATLKSLFDRPRLVPTVSKFLAILAITLIAREEPWQLRMNVNGADTRRTVFPQAAINYLKANNFRGTLMTGFETGAYANWRLHPHIKTALDSRYEVAFDPRLVDEVLQIYISHDEKKWLSILEQYKPDILLVPKHPTRWNVLTQQSQRWYLIYEDDLYMLFTQNAENFPVERRIGRTNDKPVFP